ncbi:Porphobilinogen synthase [Desulfurispirillum indicum S5]|uniref:Delta-aminolevulinic acid dehydratase n=1 Tax=Desulfurispirillum indicum (strain ATCC BAA-1389 / DSM 22839 / S5) TaxID=653733 RepID=E6W1M3_DESIS|nr:porphobilinogen synthase [Desulfurispirillum indicum]ADU66572.1 Porphobilinogen synthase [Desulfurispirillum indicum S5]
MQELIRRPRRLRTSPTLRRMVQETTLTPSDFVMPLFICHGEKISQPVGSMPGVNRVSIDVAVAECRELQQLGIPAVILFGIPAAKDPLGKEGYDDNGIIQQAVRAIKQAVPELLVITDVCLCEYTDHGHCGVIVDGDVHNDTTVELLVKEAISHARAGADIVAPSDMMDGRIGSIREGLDEAGFSQIPVMSYSVKYCSAFYGPFRDAADSTPQFGDRKTYQMDPANSREAIVEASLDVEEGADFLMVKPALPYLDIIASLKENFSLPLAAYHVSGEYAMIKAAGRNGWLDEAKAMEESLLSIKRAGADIIISYYAKEFAQRYQGK